MISRYATLGEVLDYCRYSANPVGRLVLYACGYSDDERFRLSDATCTALQLANFWQDVSTDYRDRDRNHRGYHCEPGFDQRLIYPHQ